MFRSLEVIINICLKPTFRDSVSSTSNIIISLKFMKDSCANTLGFLGCIPLVLLENKTNKKTKRPKSLVAYYPQFTHEGTETEICKVIQLIKWEPKILFK